MGDGKTSRILRRGRREAAVIARRLRRIHPHVPRFVLSNISYFRLFGLLLILSVFVVYGVFRSERAQDMLRRRAQSALEGVSGRRVTIGGFDLRLLPFAFVVKDVTIGNDKRGVPGSLFSAREIEVRGLPSIDARRIDIPKIRIVEPRVVIEVFEDGSTNLSSILSQLPKSDGGGGIDVRLGEAVLQKATFRFREWDSQIDIVLKDAAFTASSGRFSKVTHALLACRRATFRLEQNQPLSFQLGASAVLSPGRVHLTSLRLRSERLSVDASGGIDDLRHPEVLLRASATTTGRSLRDLFGLGLPLEGAVATSGTIRITPGKGFRIRGRFDLPEARLGPFPMAGSGFIRVDPNGLEAHLQKGTYAGGSLEAAIRLVRLDRPPLPIKIVIKARGVDFEQFFGDIDIKGTGLMARADLETTLTFGEGGIEKADGVGTLRLVADPGRRSAVASRHALPTSGGGPLLVRKGAIQFDHMPFNTAGGAHLGLDGHLTLGTWVPDLRIDVAAADLTEVERLAENFYPAIQKEPLTPPLRMGGSGRIAAHLTRSFADPHVEGRLEATDFVLKGARFGESSAQFVVDRNVLTLSPFVSADGGGRLDVSGSIGWGGALKGHYRLDGLVSRFDRWPIERVLGFLDIDLPLTGPVSGRLPLDGVTPDLVGAVRVSWAPATVWGQPFEEVDGDLGFEKDRLRLANVQASIGGGRLSGGGVYRYDRRFELGLTFADLPIERVQEIAAGVPGLTGVAGGKIAGEGDVDHPSLSLEAKLAEPRFDGRGLTDYVSPIDVTADRSGDTWTASLSGAGLGHVVASAEGQKVHVALEATSLSPFSRLLRIPEGTAFAGALELVADVEGGTTAGTLKAHGLRIGETRLEVAPTRFQVSEGRVHVDSLDVSSESSALRLSGAVGLAAPHSLDVTASGSVEAGLLTPILEGAESAGKLSVEARVLGTADKPVFSGRIGLDGVRYVSGATRFDDIHGELLLSPGRISADAVSLTFGGGAVAIGGTIGLEGLAFDGFRLNAHLDRVRQEPFPGFRATVSGDLLLLGDRTIRSARGELVLVRGVYGEDIDLGLGTLLSRLRPTSDLPTRPSTFDAVALDVRIACPPGSMEVRNNVARLKASGDLVARGTLGRPILFGQLTSEEGGRLTLRDVKYELVSGRVLFSNPSRIDPFFEVEARTTIKQWEIGFGLTGTVFGRDSRLVPRFSSDPPLSEAQIVSLLLTGELPGTNSLGVATGATPVSSDASIANATRELIATLATQAVTDRTKELFRLDRLQIDPVFVGSSFDAPRLTIGKAISKDVTVTYSYKASSSQQQVIVVEYQVSPRAFIQAARDENGIYSIDVKLRQQLR